MISLIIENNSQSDFTFRNRISSRFASSMRPIITAGETLKITGVQYSDLYWWAEDIDQLIEDVDFSVAVLNELEGTFVSYGAFNLNGGLSLGSGPRPMSSVIVNGNLVIDETANVWAHTLVVRGDMVVDAAATGSFVNVYGKASIYGDLDLQTGNHLIVALDALDVYLSGSASLDAPGARIKQNLELSNTSTMQSTDLSVGGNTTVGANASLTTKAARLANAPTGTVANTPAVVIP
jgi:hypothetical protein